MVATAKIQASDVKRNTRANAGLTLWGGAACGLAGLYLQAESIIKGVPLGLTHLEIDIFVAGFAVRILNRHIHLIKDAHIVEAALRIQHVALAEGLARVDLHLTFHHERTSKVQ